MTKRVFGVVDGRGRRVGATRLETVATWGSWWLTDGARRPGDPAGSDGPSPHHQPAAPAIRIRELPLPPGGAPAAVRSVRGPPWLLPGFCEAR